MRISLHEGGLQAIQCWINKLWLDAYNWTSAAQCHLYSAQASAEVRLIATCWLKAACCATATLPKWPATQPPSSHMRVRFLSGAAPRAASRPCLRLGSSAAHFTHCSAHGFSGQCQRRWGEAVRTWQGAAT